MRFWCNDAEKDDLPIELPVLEQAPERARAGHDLLHRTIETVYALSPLGLVAPEAAATEAFPFIELWSANIPSGGGRVGGRLELQIVA